MIKNDLRFLLKEKYNITEYDIQIYLETFEKLNVQILMRLNQSTDYNLVEENIKEVDSWNEIEKYVNTEGTISINKAINEIKANKRDLDIKLSDDILGDYGMYLNGYPLAYIIGYIDFINIKVDLTYKTLIPRPETEYWVNKFIQKHKNNKNLYALDIFSGSGCIGIAILKNIENSYVVFSDISENSIKQIDLNLKLNNIEPKRYKIIQSDLFENIDQNPQFQYIFANPPYVGMEDIKSHSIDYEPHEAIYSSNEGLKETDLFLSKANKYFLKSLYMEINEFREFEIEEIIHKYNYKTHKSCKDQYGKKRLLVIKKQN